MFIQINQTNKQKTMYINIAVALRQAWPNLKYLCAKGFVTTGWQHADGTV